MLDLFKEELEEICTNEELEDLKQDYLTQISESEDLEKEEKQKLRITIASLCNLKFHELNDDCEYTRERTERPNLVEILERPKELILNKDKKVII